jgi:Bacterial PH domain
MEDASAGVRARFRPTRRQALSRGLFLGVLVASVALCAGLLAATAAVIWIGAPTPPLWVWPALAFAPPVLGGVLGVPLGRRLGTEIDAGGIRTVAPFARGTAPWSRVVDLRAERRGARTVVSVYLDTGRSVQLRAPYSGELFAADPQFELKVFALSHLWRSHRFGGLPT